MSGSNAQTTQENVVLQPPRPILCSSLVLSIPTAVFEEPAARELLVNLIYTLENEFPNWSVRRLPAGRVLQDYCIKLPEPSYVVTISDPGRQFALAEQILSEAIVRLPDSGSHLSIWYCRPQIACCGDDASLAVH